MTAAFSLVARLCVPKHPGIMARSRESIRQREERGEESSTLHKNVEKERLMDRALGLYHPDLVHE